MECVTELDYNLARAHDDSGRPDLSEPIYRAHARDGFRRASRGRAPLCALLELGNHLDAHALLDGFDARCRIRASKAEVEHGGAGRNGPTRHWTLESRWPKSARCTNGSGSNEQASGFALMRALLRFQLDLVEERWPDAERSFHNLEKVSSDLRAELPALLVSELFARTGNIEAALVWAETALEKVPENWHALSLAARLHFESRRDDEALELAAESLGLIYFQPRTHYLMGLAQQRLGDFAGAELTLRVAPIETPGLVKAHDALVDLYDKESRRPADAALHRARASDIRRDAARHVKPRRAPSSRNIATERPSTHVRAARLKTHRAMS